jgi:Protein of unknown function (DUF2569)
MFCVSCGKAYEANHKFCNYCGQPVSAIVSEPPSPTEAAQNPATPVSSDSIPAHDAVVAGLPVAVSDNAVSIRIVDHELEGLRGWLVLVGIGLFIGPFYWLYAICQDVTLFNNGTVQFLSDPSSSAYIGGYSGLLKFELVGQIVLLAADILLINLFFRRRHEFPRSYVAFLLAILIFATIDYGLVAFALAHSAQGLQKTLDETMSGQSSQIGRAVVAAVVWGSYMVKSKRVKATFTKQSPRQSLTSALL